MVDKKANAKTLMSIFFGLILVIVLGVFVFAFSGGGTGITFNNSVVNGGNYTEDTLLIEVNATMVNTSIGVNVTCFWNSSGGSINDSDVTFDGTGFTSDVDRLTLVIWNGTKEGNTTNFTYVADISGLIDSNTYNISCVRNDGNDQNWTSLTNVTIDRNPPAVSFSTAGSSYLLSTNGSIVNNGNYTTKDIVKNLFINVSILDAIDRVKYGENLSGSVYMNVTNRTGQVNLTRLLNLSDITTTAVAAFYNATINMSNSTFYPDGTYTLTIYANDSMNDSITNANNLNNTESIQFTIDRTAPGVPVLTKGTGTTASKNVITITADDGTYGSGINTCVVKSVLRGSSAVSFGSSNTITGTGTGTQTLTHTGLSCGTSYSYTVECTDQVDLSANSASTTFSTLSCSGSGGNGGGTTTVIEKVNVFNVGIGEEMILYNFEEDMGVEEIKITVTEQANDVKVTVRKFSVQPSEITVAKAGNVHKYIQITSENLADKMDKAVLTIKVQKNWLLDTGISQSNIAAFKFNEAAGEWDELLTVYESEDDTYYYYNVEVTSFSYFAIAEKVIGGDEEPEEASNLLWLWITIGIVVVAIIVGGGFAVKKKR